MTLKALAEAIESGGDLHFRYIAEDPILRFEDARIRGYLTLTEAQWIVTHKSHRNTHFSQNEKGDVESISRFAFDLSNNLTSKARIQVLSSLSGVQIPTASCFLAWVYPDEWPVIDRRALSTLQYFNIQIRNERSPITSAVWERYVQIIRELKALIGLRLRPVDVERALYAIDKDRNGSKASLVR